MILFIKNYNLCVWILVFSTGILIDAGAQDHPPEFIREAVQNIERMITSEDDSTIESFIERSMVKKSNLDQDSLVNELRNLRNKLKGFGDDLAVEAEPDGVRLILSNGQNVKQLKLVLDFEAEAVAGLYLLEPPAQMNVTKDNLSETVDQLEETGMAGVLYVKMKDEVVIKRAFGLSNKDLGTPNTLQTIFGTGSRPIDYTVAAIYLLDQQKSISLDDKITNYLKDVPEEKSAITIRHLMTGRSGLPDFFDTEEDWDPDLAWIDRETAVKRLLAQDLLFPPGEGHRHSHGAFGLLAAIIEIVTGATYYGFIRANFLDPAGMTRTGEYGEHRGLSVTDFAAGGGPQIIGLPNIPPNWGPTSWLIKGSGGMYSTLDDLLSFNKFVRSGQVLDEEHNSYFHQPAFNLDGSDRGFELFSAWLSSGDEVYLFLNEPGDHDKMRQLIRALKQMVDPD